MGAPGWCEMVRRPALLMLILILAKEPPSSPSKSVFRTAVPTNTTPSFNQPGQPQPPATPTPLPPHLSARHHTEPWKHPTLLSNLSPRTTSTAVRLIIHTLLPSSTTGSRPSIPTFSHPARCDSLVLRPPSPEPGLHIGSFHYRYPSRLQPWVICKPTPPRHTHHTTRHRPLSLSLSWWGQISAPALLSAPFLCFHLRKPSPRLSHSRHHSSHHAETEGC